MKKSVYKLPAFLFVTVLFGSCSDVVFEKPQPIWVTKNETAIPKNLQGYYASGADTLRITEQRIVDTKAKPDFDYTLSDSVQLKIYNGDYFPNLHDEEKGNWQMVMAKAENNYIVLYTLSFKDSTVQKKVRAITGVKEIQDANGNGIDYLINPTAEAFHKILNQNLFTLPPDTLWKVK